jgi:Protein of unknown function (DUF3592)
MAPLTGGTINKRMQKSITQKASAKGGTCGCFAFGLIFFLFGGAFFALAFGRGFLKLVEAREWTPTPCTILSSEVQSHGDTYSVEVRFSYNVNEHNYESTRFDFVEGSSSGYDSKAKIVRQIPAGTRTTCYVNPKDPADAVLERGFTNEMYFAGIPLLFAFIGLAGMYFAITGRLGAGTPSGAQKVAALPAGGTKRKSSRWGSLAGIIFIAAFWNGIVSIFLWQAVQSWKAGRAEIGLSLFLIPFVLIGLGLIVAIFYQFLALFNPVAELNFIPLEVRLGQSMQLSWKFRGKVDRISQLRIRLEAREEATYRRGTRSYTDTEVFLKKDLFQTTNTYNISTGSISIPIPEDSMHSLDTGNNKIIWTLYFEGDIKNWPDVAETYEIKILP